MLQRLREARERAGFTQREVAARLGKPQSYIHKWEVGERQLNVIDLRNLCEALEISFIEFLQELDDELRHEQATQNP